MKTTKTARKLKTARRIVKRRVNSVRSQSSKTNVGLHTNQTSNGVKRRRAQKLSVRKVVISSRERRFVIPISIRMPIVPQKGSLWTAVFRKKVFSVAKTGLVLTLIVLLNLFGLSSIGNTIAFYNDVETSSGNAHIAGSVDFSLDADEWSPVETAGALEPGDTITRNMSVLAGDSIPFQYKIKTVKTSGDDDFCNALDLVATRESFELYDGDLMSFDLTPPVAIGGDNIDDWIFEVTLPDGSGPFDGASCEFRFDVDGWQIGFPDGLSGFSDHEELENIIESSVAETEDGLDNISPIADSYVDQDDPNDSGGGNDHELKVRSQSSNKNRRAFIRFDFLFPMGTVIQSSVLKLFLDDAPSASRTYALSRALSSWSESGLTWNNQPATMSGFLGM